jgi:hypothetical protein
MLMYRSNYRIEYRMAPAGFNRRMPRPAYFIDGEQAGVSWEHVRNRLPDIPSHLVKDACQHARILGEGHLRWGFGKWELASGDL